MGRLSTMRIIAFWVLVLVPLGSGCGADAKTSEGHSESRPALAMQTSKEECKNPFAGSGDLNFSTKGWATNFCRHSIPYAEIRSGGRPRDGIPPIDAPKFVSRMSADAWLKDVEP